MLLMISARPPQPPTVPPSRPFDYLIHFLFGCLAVLSFAPFSFFPLIFLSLGWLYAFLCFSQLSFRKKVLRLLAFHLGFFLAGVHWVYISIQEFGGMPTPLAVLMTFLFCLYLSVYPLSMNLLFSFLLKRFTHFLHVVPIRGLLFSILWLVGEILRGEGALGFPWLHVGYTQVPTGLLTDYFPLVGIYGVSLLVVFLTTLLIELFDQSVSRTFKRMMMPGVLACMLMIGGIASHHYTMPTQKVGTPFRVSLLQGNIQQSLKFSTEGYVHTLKTYAHLLKQQQADFIVLPETAFPVFYHQIPQTYLKQYQQQIQTKKQTLLFGVPELNVHDSTYYNSVIQLNFDKSAVYRKTHLVPFGEYLPFPWLFKPLMATMQIPFSEFSSGPATPQYFWFNQHRFGVSICYEDVFTRQMMQSAAQAAFLVNVSNDAWFGESIAMHQHVQMAQARALESRKYLIRATNTGITAVIDPAGHIVKSLPPFETNVLSFSGLQGYLDQTPYVRWIQWFNE